MEGFAKYVTGNFLIWEKSIGKEEEQWVGMSVGDFKDMFGAERMRIVSGDYYGGVELFGLGDGFFFVFFFLVGNCPLSIYYLYVQVGLTDG